MYKGKSKKKYIREESFSKKILKQELALIWITTLSLIILAYICVFKGYFGELPWLAAMCGFPWSAWGVSKATFHSKSKAENTKDGIIFETAMKEFKDNDGSGAVG